LGLHNSNTRHVFIREHEIFERVNNRELPEHVLLPDPSPCRPNGSYTARSWHKHLEIGQETQTNLTVPVEVFVKESLDEQTGRWAVNIKLDLAR
jgi:hypothetical protein